MAKQKPNLKQDGIPVDVSTVWGGRVDGGGGRRSSSEQVPSDNHQM